MVTKIISWCYFPTCFKTTYIVIQESVILGYKVCFNIVLDTFVLEKEYAFVCIFNYCSIYNEFSAYLIKAKRR